MHLGKLYDITNLKHPGGSIINYYNGDPNKPIDATEGFIIINNITIFKIYF